MTDPDPPLIQYTRFSGRIENDLYERSRDRAHRERRSQMSVYNDALRIGLDALDRGVEVAVPITREQTGA